MSEIFSLRGVVDLCEIAMIFWLFIWHNRLAKKIEIQSNLIHTQYVKASDIQVIAIKLSDTNKKIDDLVTDMQDYLTRLDSLYNLLKSKDN